MSDSLFLRIFSYRQRKNNAPLENFITEIFSFCFENDKQFRKDFFHQVLELNEPQGDCEVLTQCSYEGYGRPDMEVSYPDSCFLIESKVEASERVNQLADYALILKTCKSKLPYKHIIFLTKYFEQKELKQNDIQLHLVRWFAVYEIINETHAEITRQLKYFLKENGMEKVKNFTVEDLLAMKTIPETISKMNELLEQFKPEFIKQFGGFSTDASRSTRLPYKMYINYVQLSYDNADYHILVGFFWWWEGYEFPYVGLSVELPSKKFRDSELTRILDKELVEKANWEFEDNGPYCNYNSVKPLTDFITMEDDNLPAMKKFVQSQLDILYDLRREYPELFKK